MDAASIDWAGLVSGILVGTIATISLTFNLAMNELFWRGWRDR